MSSGLRVRVQLERCRSRGPGRPPGGNLNRHEISSLMILLQNSEPGTNMPVIMIAIGRRAFVRVRAARRPSDPQAPFLRFRSH